MFKILTLNKIADCGLSLFPKESYNVGTALIEPDAILLRSSPLEEAGCSANLKVVGRAGVGVNNLPLSALTKRGIPVLNTPGANANAVRELVLAGMLMASRKLKEALYYVKTLDFKEEGVEVRLEQDKKQFVGFELAGKTLGLIGLGAVGVKVANAALDLGLRVIGYDPSISVGRAWELSAKVEQAPHLEYLLATSDFVSLHVPLVPETRGLINEKRLTQMKKQAVLLNFAREAIVEEEALVAALECGHLLSYVNDFPTRLLKGHPRVLSFPHLGASTQEAEENCARMIVKQVRDFLEKGSISHSVNFPSIDLEPTPRGVRLALVNANIPNMVAQISSTLAAANLNILSLMNQSKGDLAYTLIDVDQAPSVAVLETLATIEGVIQLRRVN